MDDGCDLLCLDLPRAEILRAEAPAREELVGLAVLAKGLGDPTRLGLALALRDGGELCGCDLAWIAGLAQNLVSHHLRALRDAGICSSRREGKIVFYGLTPAGERLLAALHGSPAGAA